MTKIHSVVDPAGNAFTYRTIDHPEYKYELLNQYTVQLHFIPDKGVSDKFCYLSENGVLVMRIGYRWDGVSGPMIDTKNTMRAGGIHDAGYRMIRRGVMPLSSKNSWDTEFRIVMEEDWKPVTIFGEMWNWVRATYAYQGVNLFGTSSCVPMSQVK